MRTITLDECAQRVKALFNEYVQYYGLSMCYGSVPTAVLEIHKRGTRESADMATVRFKNTLNISVFRMIVYLDDLFRMARNCRIWLITGDIFDVLAMYCMLHPLAQTQHMDFRISTDHGVEHMLVEAGKDVYDFMDKVYPFTTGLGHEILDILNFHLMMETSFENWWGVDYGGGTPEKSYERHRRSYERLMMENHEQAYRTARARKAYTGMVDEDGLIILERRTAGTIEQERHDTDERNLPTRYDMSEAAAEEECGRKATKKEPSEFTLLKRKDR